MDVQRLEWHGIVYPAPKPRGFNPLEYLARYFDTIEINSSFYGAPRADRLQGEGMSFAEARAAALRGVPEHAGSHGPNDGA